MTDKLSISSLVLLRAVDDLGDADATLYQLGQTLALLATGHEQQGDELSSAFRLASNIILTEAKTVRDVRTVLDDERRGREAQP